MTRLLALSLAGLFLVGCGSSSPAVPSREAGSAVAEAQRAVARAEADSSQARYLDDARRNVARAQAALAAGDADEAAHRAYLARQGARLAALQAEIDGAERAVADGGNRLVITDAFQTGRVTLRPEAQATVDRIAAYLAARPDRVALVESFTDATGNPDRNLDLSIRRAEAVKARMAEAGVADDQVVTVGFGQEYPVAPNDTAAGQRENRRVEVVIAESIDLLPPRQ